jgi:lysophospholipase L1-like esterase
MSRRRNPSDLLLYALVGAGVFMLSRMLFAPASASAAPLNTGSNTGALPSQPAADPNLRINWPTERVLVIGDSLGVGVQPLLQRAMQARGVGAFSGISVGGKNIKQWSDNTFAEGRALEAALADFRPTLVLISLGTNDEASRGYKDWRGRDWDADDLAANRVGPNFSVANQRASAIARLARKLSGVKSVYLGPPASDPRIWPMDRALRDLLASTWQGRYFNTEAVAPAKGGDGIHFSGSGNRAWADAIMAYLDARAR